MTTRLSAVRKIVALTAFFVACSASAANADRAPSAPGIIPHPIEAYVPITLEKNACTARQAGPKHQYSALALSQWKTFRRTL